MKRAVTTIANKRTTYGVRELSAKKVASELRNHCGRELLNHYAFRSITTIIPNSKFDEGGYRFTITALVGDKRKGLTQEERERGLKRVFVDVIVKPDLGIHIDPDSEFPMDMLDCLLSAGEKAFR